MLAPHDAFFLPNFSFYWGGQLAIIAVLFIARPSAAGVAAMAAVLAAILLVMGLWVQHRTGAHPDGLVWLIYPILLFGAALGGLVATWWCNGAGGYTAVKMACATGLTAAGGSCVSTVLACHTVFYCH